MALPDFVIIGAQKAGTTWLMVRLGEHPQVFMHSKEVHYFDVEENYRQGIEWYQRHFEAATAGQRIGEKTPDYLWVDRPQGVGGVDIAKRLHDLLPAAKLLVVLRNPVARTLSSIGHQIRARRLSPSVDIEAVLFGRDRHLGQKFGLIERGYYADQIASYQRLFPDERIRVLIFETDIADAPEATLGDVCDYLDIDREFTPNLGGRTENQGMNSRLGLALNYHLPWAGSAVRYLDRYLPKTKVVDPGAGCVQRLYEHFAPWNERLFDLIGRRIDAWSPDAEAGTKPTPAPRRVANG